MATYFITGATGYIGGSVAAALIDAGHGIRGLVRSRDAAARLAERGVVPVLGTLDDLDLLAAEVRTADGVINAASADNSTAAQAFIESLAGTGKPLLHTSGSSVVGDDARGNFLSQRVFDEQGDLIVHPLKQARHEINQMLVRAADRGVRSVVICPSLIYGTGRGLNPASIQIPFLVAEARKRGAVTVVGAGLNTWSNVHIDDVVTLYLLALEQAPAGSFYFAENGEASFLEIAQALSTRLALPRIEHMAAEEAAQQWGEAMAYFSLGGNSRVRAKRARDELGWTPHHTSLVDWIRDEMVT